MMRPARHDVASVQAARTVHLTRGTEGGCCKVWVAGWGLKGGGSPDRVGAAGWGLQGGVAGWGLIGWGL